LLPGILPTKTKFPILGNLESGQSLISVKQYIYVKGKLLGRKNIAATAKIILLAKINFYDEKNLTIPSQRRTKGKLTRDSNRGGWRDMNKVPLF